MEGPIQLVTLAPGHFHAALVQREHLSGVAPTAHVFAPLDEDLVTHLERIARFNRRPERPTHWAVNVRAGEDWLERFQQERPGNVVVLAGRNRPKLDLLFQAARAGYSMLVDKPWIVDADDYPRLRELLKEIDRRGLLAWDIMTERWEVASRLQRELLQDSEILGELVPGTVDEPALRIESVHCLCKQVAGAPLRRPAWWYDPDQAGEGIADVGTHLADLAMWLLFPDEAIDAERDLAIHAAKRWPTPVDRASFEGNTGLPGFPGSLNRLVSSSGHLDYWGNGSVQYRLRGRWIHLTTRWNVRATSPDGDTHFCQVRGSRSEVIVCHEENLAPGPQLVVRPSRTADSGDMQRRLSEWARRHEGLTVENLSSRFWIRIPDSARTGHESHFATVLQEFLNYYRDRSRIPSWERANLLAKYRLTTEAVRLGRRDVP